MKFLLMIVSDEQGEAARSPAEVERIIAQHQAVGRELRAAGRWIDGARLRFGRDAVTVRVRDDRPVVLDGPFAESKEVLGGFYLIEAASRDEAVGWAKKLPLGPTGAIEVRPLWE
ncbi:MAG TPA: YciI family protein [Candidatus Binatia bacterium]|nr:YciI family protein [Candidatus Binatia bacterium]